MSDSFRWYYNITDLLKILTTQSPWWFTVLLGQFEIHKITLFRISFLKCHPADFLQDGQIMSCRIYRKSFVLQNIILKLPRNVFIQLTKSDITCLESFLNKFTKIPAGVNVC